MAQLKDLIVTGPSRLIGEVTLTQLSVPTASNGTTLGLGTDGQVLATNSSSVYWLTLGTAAAKAITDKSAATAIGNSDTNLITARAVYYGLPTINNAHNYTSSTTIYAPTAGGTQNTQALVGNGATTAPKWVNISPSISITAGNGTDAPKVNVTVLGQSGTAQSITKASKDVYGVTKLSSSTTSDSEELAATPKAVSEAIKALDSDLPSGSAASKTLTALSIVDGKMNTATFSSIAIAASQVTSGTLTVARGGTGKASFAADSIIMSGSSTTAAFTTRGITNTTTAGALGGKTTWAADTTIPTINTLAYWDGRYQSTSNKSNLTYCVKGAFGDLAIINKPTSNTTTTFLRGDGTWQSVTWSNVSGKPSTFTPSSHTHGNLSNDGKITTAITVAANDYLIIGDNSASGTIGKGPVFDGSTATKALTQKGTWETFNNYSHPTGDGNKHVPANGTSNDGKYLRASATAGTYTWAQVNWSELAGKPSSFTPSSHTHYELATIGDQRSTATTPNTYANRIIFSGLKNRSIWTSNTAYPTYFYTVGLRGWSDSSGGNAWELGFSNVGILSRHGATTTWNDPKWITQAAIEGVGGTTTPVYVDNNGQITAGTALGASAYHADSYFALASHGTHVTYGTSATAVETTAAAGTATTVSRSDHKHSISLATGDNNGQVKIAGTNVTVKGINESAYHADSYFVKSITSTDNAIARFNGTSGAIQNSTVTINDDGTIITGNFSIGGVKDTNAGKTISSNTTMYLTTTSASSIVFTTNNVARCRIDYDNSFRPEANRGATLGTSSYYWDGAYLNGNGNIHWNNLAWVTGKEVIASSIERGIPKAISGHDLNVVERGSRLWGMSPQSILVENTTDSGATWTTAAVTDRQKRGLTNGEGFGGNSTAGIGLGGLPVDVGKNNTQTITAGIGQRITIDLQVENRTGAYIYCFDIYIIGRDQKFDLLLEKYNKYTDAWTTVYTASKVALGSEHRVIYPTTAPYLYGNSSSSSGTSYRANKLRLTVILSEVVTASTRYCPYISKIGGWGNAGLSHNRTSTYPSGRLFDITMAQYGQPYYLSDRNSGNITVPASQVTIYGVGGYNAASTDVYATLVLGNNGSRGAAGSHSEGRIYLYSASTAAHVILGTSTGSEIKHYFPNSAGWIATGGNGASTGAGDTTHPVFLSTAGVLTQCSGTLPYNISGTAGGVAWANITGMPSAWTSAIRSNDVWLMAQDNSGKEGGQLNFEKPSAQTLDGMIDLYSSDNVNTLMRIGNLSAVTVNFNITDHSIWANGDIHASKVYNAVWNDYAEYRQSKEEEPGRVVVDTSHKIMERSTTRLQPGAHIISDTYGNSVGMSDEAKTPIGIAGRVLAYTYQDRNNYHIGDAVCAAPNGTIDIMTREEIIQYPDRIIGIVSEIPDYEIWDNTYTNEYNKYPVHTNIKVNGRIWVYVR